MTKFTFFYYSLEEISRLPNVRRTAGGSGLNVLRAAQWTLQIPNVCTFTGSIGDDDNSQLLLRTGRESGLNLQCQVVENCPTSMCVVLVCGTHRAMCSFQNASGKFRLDEFLQPKIQEYFARASVIYLSVMFRIQKVSQSIETYQMVADKSIWSNWINAMQSINRLRTHLINAPVACIWWCFFSSHSRASSSTFALTPLNTSQNPRMSTENDWCSISVRRASSMAKRPLWKHLSHLPTCYSAMTLNLPHWAKFLD